MDGSQQDVLHSLVLLELVLQQLKLVLNVLFLTFCLLALPLNFLIPLDLLLQLLRFGQAITFQLLNFLLVFECLLRILLDFILNKYNLLQA